MKYFYLIGLIGWFLASAHLSLAQADQYVTLEVAVTQVYSHANGIGCYQGWEGISY